MKPVQAALLLAAIVSVCFLVNLPEPPEGRPPAKLRSLRPLVRPLARHPLGPNPACEAAPAARAVVGGGEPQLQREPAPEIVDGCPP